MKLLEFVALYGFILAPVGAIIVFEHFFAKRMGIIANYAAQSGVQVNLAVLLAWGISFALFYYISWSQDIFLSFLTLPAWLSCGVLFLIFSKYFNKK